MQSIVPRIYSVVPRIYIFVLTITAVLLVGGFARAGDTPPVPGAYHWGQDYIVSEHCQTGPTMQFISDPSYRLKVFLNFEGAQLKGGGSDSKTNQTRLILGSSLAFPAQSWTSMGGKDKGLKDVLTELRLLYGNYAVEFVTKRPDSGDYTMVMSGGNGDGCKKGGAGTVGIAPLDCKNSNKNDIVLVYGDRLSSAKKLAFVIAHELGHSFGLEHVSDNTDIMAPALSGSTCCWTTSAVSGGGTCGRTTQDAKKVLSDNLGVGEGDTILPIVWFVRPGNGAVLPSRFTFEVRAADDLKVHHVDIYLDNKKIETINTAPFSAVVSGLSSGDHTLRAEVFDYKPNKATAQVSLTVDTDCVASGNCNTGQAGEGASCSTGGDCISGICAKKDGKGLCVVSCESKGKLCPSNTTCSKHDEQWACTAGAGFSLDLEDESGGCSVAGRAGAGLWMLLLLGLALLRRRSPALDTAGGVALAKQARPTQEYDCVGAPCQRRRWLGDTSINRQGKCPIR